MDQKLAKDLFFEGQYVIVSWLAQSQQEVGNGHIYKMVKERTVR